MSETSFARLDEALEAQGASAAIDQLIESLRAEKEYHRLFDAAPLHAEIGLPLRAARGGLQNEPRTKPAPGLRRPLHLTPYRGSCASPDRARGDQRS